MTLLPEAQDKLKSALLLVITCPADNTARVMLLNKANRKNPFLPQPRSYSALPTGRFGL